MLGRVLSFSDPVIIKLLQENFVAVVGDGALTCGLSYEGMNNAGHSDRDIILIVNDNGMSISPNVGAISKTLGRIVADPPANAG